MSRWLLEPKTGIFLGNPSARVRDELWNKSVKKAGQIGTVLQIWTDQNPQGFSYRQLGNSERSIVDFEGIALVRLDKSVDTKTD